MESSELMFLFEITVDEIKSFSKAKNHKIRVRFGDVFTLKLKDPNQVVAEAMVIPRNGRRNKRPLKIRNGRVLSPNNLESSQIAVVVSDIESLERSMLNYPIELTHYSKDEPFVLGVVEIPWTMLHIEYLKNLINDVDQPPVVLKGTYKTYDEYTSKRVAVITLTISLSQIRDNFAMTTKIKSKTGVQNDNLIADIDDNFSIGTIRTIYSGGKLDGHKKHKNDKKDSTTQNKNVNVLHNAKKINAIDPNITQECNNKNVNVLHNAKKINAIDPNITQECNKIATVETDNIIEVRNTEEYGQNVTQDFYNISHTKMNQKSDEITKNETDIYHDQDIVLLTQRRSSSICKNIHKTSTVNLTRSQHIIDKTDLSSIQPISKNSKCWSNTAIELKERLDTLNYIFGNTNGPFGNRVYCVEYFTVEHDQGAGVKGKGSDKGSSPPKSPKGTSSTKSPKGTSSTKSPKETPATSPAESPAESPAKTPAKTPAESPAESPAEGPAEEVGTPKRKKIIVEPDKREHLLNVCDDKCIFGGPKNPCFKNVCEIDLPENAAKLIDVTKCTHNTCIYRKQPASLTDPFPDEVPIQVDFGKSRTTAECCAKEVEQVEVFSGMTANLIKDPCSCTCECTFGFIAKTTYCNICGGFEVAGDEMKSARGGAPFPCPIYHGWQGKGKKGLSKKSSATGDDKSKKSIESDKESGKKGKKHRRWRDPRFKFNYGYKGIPPQIGHSQCAMPCTGDLFPVPKHMGWLWTADNIPGLKVRPNWRPGAANKHVVRMYRMARFPDEIISKRRKKDIGKKKRPMKRPLLVVQKKDGEYNVTMETMKTFTKPRAVNQYPYEDRPLVQYTIGRTDEENAERKKRKERAQRRLEREQRAFLQSAFHDMCKEICLKTYQQALGMLPFAEDSWCPCYPLEPPPDKIDMSHSCSCTESTRSSGSMTDDDEWVVEFTPPNAYFNPTRVIKKIILADSSTQYSYLDFRVKLFDRFGNPVPRFFTGPDGKQECSDLGGFWGPGKKWLEINSDGYIAPDGRWAPHSFIGPCGEHVDGEGGTFVSSNGVTLTVGVDGYVDGNNKWHFYTKPKTDPKDPKFQRNVEAWKKAGGCVVPEADGISKPKKQKQHKPGYDRRHRKPQSETFSCFGDTSPRTLSQMGIAGHGHDRRLLLSTLEQLLKQGEKLPYRPPNYPKRSYKHKKNKPKHTEPGEIERQIYPEKIKSKRRQKSPMKAITAVNDRGHKTSFQLNETMNPRAKQRIKKLGEAGISVSSFHVPCFSSFINSEMARQQQLQHILQHNARIQGAGMPMQTSDAY